MTPGHEPRTLILAAALVAAAVLAVIIAGCAANSPPPASPASPAPASQDTASFIRAANDCQDASLTVTSTVGTFSYQSTSDCDLLKTLVKVNSSELPEVKNLIEGKSMVCGYTKGNFDSRWVTTLIGGMENCHGDLRDGLAQLMVFTSS